MKQCESHYVEGIRIAMSSESDYTLIVTFTALLICFPSICDAWRLIFDRELDNIPINLNQYFLIEMEKHCYY